MAAGAGHLTTIVTTDLAAVTRGRSVLTRRYEEDVRTSVGWLPANISLTPFNTIASPNPWGSLGDLRLLPDRAARYRTDATGSATPFDMVIADIVELDGSPWSCCPRTVLRHALDALEQETGLRLLVAVEQEFQIAGGNFPPAVSLSLAALRRTDPFGPMLMASLAQASVEPENFLAEFGENQFEITCRPADPVTAADRAVAIREIARETARMLGWRASFAPKSAPDAVGAGVHIHVSLRDHDDRPVTYDAARPGRLSEAAGAFCAGIVAHLPALTACTAPSVPSYYRLQPHRWSASYTWLGERNREATLRICPVTSLFGQAPDAQFNIEYRAADATANPYLAIAMLVRAGLAGLRARLPTPPLVSEDPTAMSEAQRAALGLVRLPETLEAALAALEADRTVCGWFGSLLLDSFLGVKRNEIAITAALTPDQICQTYSVIY